MAGEGVDGFGSKSEATAYLTKLQSHVAEGLEIYSFSIRNSTLRGLSSFNVNALSDSAAESWMNSNFRPWGGTPNHGFQWVQRGTGNIGTTASPRFGTENFFHHSVIPRIKF